MSSFSDWDSTIKLELSAGGGMEHLFSTDFSVYSKGIEWNGKKLINLQKRGEKGQK